MIKLDVKKNMKELDNPSKKEPGIVDVPPMNFIMLDGHGNPNNNPAYNATIDLLINCLLTSHERLFYNSANIEYLFSFG